MNLRTAIIRCFGTTGVLLALSLVLLALVSAIVAFDRWPEGTGAGTVQPVAVEPGQARRVDTVAVRTRPRITVARGVFVARAPATSGLTLARPGGASGDGGPGGRTLLSVVGPPPPTVPASPPGEGGGGATRVARQPGAGSQTPPGEPNVVRDAACGARDALSTAGAGAALDPACQPGGKTLEPLAAEAVDTVTHLTGLVLKR